MWYDYLPVDIEFEDRPEYYEALDVYGVDPKVENLSDFREMIYKKEKDMLLEYKSEIEAVK